MTQMSDMSTTEIEVLPESEEERVISWRAEELMRAGFDGCTAIELALIPHVDLHKAVSLLRHGCPPSTAVRILL
jgi:hypothetical protein